MIAGSKYWQCSGCGSISSKEKTVGPIASLLELGAQHVVAGDIICSRCGTRTTPKDILDGKFDVRDPDELVDMVISDPGNARWHRWKKKWSYKGTMLQGPLFFEQKRRR